jgi:CRISPR-associated protein Csx14
MGRAVLISSLGDSPAVVIETIDALDREEKIRLDVVVTICTNDVDSKRSSEYLTDVIYNDYNGRVEYIPDYLNKFDDIDSEEASAAFMEKVCGWINNYQGCDVYLSLAGGRKTMSAIMALAAQFYPTKLLCHVIVDPITEQEGKIDALRRKPQDEQKQILHCQEAKLVRLPVVSLFPFLNDIIGILKGKKLDNPTVIQLLEANGLIKKGITTGIGKTILRILEQVEAPPPDSGLEPKEKINKIKYEDQNRGKHPGLESYLKKICEIPYVTRIQTYYYNPGLPEKNQFRLSSKNMEAIEGWYSDGKATTKFYVFITDPQKKSWVLKDLSRKSL